MEGRPNLVRVSRDGTLLPADVHLAIESQQLEGQLNIQEFSLLMQGEAVAIAHFFQRGERAMRFSYRKTMGNGKQVAGEVIIEIS